jgi:hypothetical protein
VAAAPARPAPDLTSEEASCSHTGLRYFPKRKLVSCRVMSTLLLKVRVINTQWECEAEAPDPLPFLRSFSSSCVSRSQIQGEEEVRGRRGGDREDGGGRAAERRRWHTVSMNLEASYQNKK